MHSQQHARLLKLVSSFSVAVALTLVIAKVIAWWQTDSSGVLASGLDSMLDLVASIFIMFAIRYALRPADDDHRFGHGKAEPLAALFQSQLMLLSALSLVILAGRQAWYGLEVEEPQIGLYVVFLSLSLTLILVLFQRYVVKITHSAAIKADSLHYQTDFLVNLGLLLELGMVMMGWHWADWLYTLGIALFLGWHAFDLLLENVHHLLDRELPEEVKNQVIDLAMSHPLVQRVNDMRSYRSGRLMVFQFHIEMDGEMSLNQAHDVTDEIVEKVKCQFPDADVVIHQEPAGLPEDHHQWVEC